MTRIILALLLAFPMAALAENESCSLDSDCPDSQQYCAQGMCRFVGEGPGDTDGFAPYLKSIMAQKQNGEPKPSVSISKLF